MTAIARARVAAWGRLLAAHGPGRPVAEYLGEARAEGASGTRRAAQEAAGQGSLL